MINLDIILLTLVSLVLRPFVNKYHQGKNHNREVNQTVLLYPENKFIKIRFWDAPYLEVEKLIPKRGKIVELGCGEGIFSNFLALASPERKIIGVEINKNRLKIANRRLKNTFFEFGDAVNYRIPSSDCIILFHLLHHLKSYQDQEKLIRNCIQSLKKQGKLLIVEVDVKFSLKYFISWFTDCFLVAWIFEKKFNSTIFFRNRSQWSSLTKDLGLSCRIISAEKGKPFSHVIFSCQKIIDISG